MLTVPVRLRDGHGAYVPISQDDRYFFCSLVSLSMATPFVCELEQGHLLVYL